MPIAKKLFLFIILLLLIHSDAIAFEVDMFKSGMSKSKVKELLKTYQHVEEKDNNIFAMKDKSSRFYSLDFCDDKLVQLQKDLSPSIKELIILFDNLTTLYGKPIDSHSEILPQKHSISFYWKNGIETIALAYTVFPTNDSLYISYEVVNKCF